MHAYILLLPLKPSLITSHVFMPPIVSLVIRCVSLLGSVLACCCERSATLNGSKAQSVCNAQCVWRFGMSLSKDAIDSHNRGADAFVIQSLTVSKRSRSKKGEDVADGNDGQDAKDSKNVKDGKDSGEVNDGNTTIQYVIEVEGLHPDGRACRLCFFKDDSWDPVQLAVCRKKTYRQWGRKPDSAGKSLTMYCAYCTKYWNCRIRRTLNLTLQQYENSLLTNKRLELHQEAAHGYP